MMDQLIKVLHNHVLICAIIGSLSGQVIKAIINAVRFHSLSLERLFGDGGMPSSHSAMVVAGAATAAFVHGLDSTYFALAVMLAIFIIHDAKGIRLEADRHTRALNEVAAYIEKQDGTKITTGFRKHNGHTVPEIIAGSAWGIVVAILYYYLFIH